MLPHLPWCCRLWEKALSLKCFQAVLVKERQNREESWGMTCAFPKTPNKQAKALQREKFMLWYSSYSTAPEILEHTVSCWWARSWTHKPWLPQKKGHLHHRARSESHTWPQTSSARKKSSGKGWLVQDSAWSMAIASMQPWDQHASPELETWRWMGLPPSGTTKLLEPRSTTPQPGKASPVVENC